MVSNGIMIVPLKSGSGVRVKLLEGLSLGVPIVTTAGEWTIIGLSQGMWVFGLKSVYANYEFIQLQS